MRILALDTSTEACSVALKSGDEISERFEVMPRQHALKLLPMIETLLNESDLSITQLDYLTFACGPGSFTGIRIAAGVVQGLAYAADLPVVQVSTLAALAQGVVRKRTCTGVVPVLDAFMGEVYWAQFRATDGVVQRVEPDTLISPEQMAPKFLAVDEPGNWVGAGPGWRLRSKFSSEVQKFFQTIDEEFLPHAKDLLPLAASKFAQGGQVSAELALPTYLREKDAWQRQSPG